MSSYDRANAKNDSLTARLNRRVSIRRPPAAYDQPVDVWPEVAKLWAGVEPLQGQEYFAAMTPHADVTTRIRIRYREGIDRTMVVRYGAVNYEILYIIHPKLAKRELQLMCKERQ